ncbi:MAG: TraR/DksA family transcriptional regulator [Betaproteobacteria bacterium]|nr:TraR/DksA family transcriptional regulator [Betaproteobacteria bacterium]
MSLNKSQLSSLTKSLDRHYKKLLEEVRDELDTPQHQQYIELIDRGPADSADEAIGDALADINLAIIDRHVGEIRDIEAARGRIKDGSFGSCVDCGNDIGLERLQVHPTAKRCLICQQQRERLYAAEGVPGRL